jgi:tRNA 2-selenouridine synthase
MTHRITIDDLMNMPEQIPFLDVRTPAEFNHGHMPGAFNIPLFSNEERVLVGTTYKQVGREAAILLGFDLVGTRWSAFIRQALDISPQKKVAVYCWRGGMRSGAMAWALDLYGFTVYLVGGGYKAYRRWVQQRFAQTWDIRVVGGMTGSGKTKILHALKEMGEQVVNLEHIAQHQGSTYGTLNRLIQPSQEQFENNMAEVLHGLDPNRQLWVEDESVTIGKRLIPKTFWEQMQTALLFNILVPVDQRVETLVTEYGSLDKDFLVESTDRIRKRLGLEQTKNAIAAIREGRIADFIRLVLVYYDKTYRIGLASRDTNRIFEVSVDDTDGLANAQRLLALTKN